MLNRIGFQNILISITFVFLILISHILTVVAFSSLTLISSVGILTAFVFLILISHIFTVVVFIQLILIRIGNKLTAIVSLIFISNIPVPVIIVFLIIIGRLVNSQLRGGVCHVCAYIFQSICLSPIPPYWEGIIHFASIGIRNEEFSPFILKCFYKSRVDCIKSSIAHCRLI